MDDKEFDRAIAELIEKEHKKARDKEPYSIDPLEAERVMIVRAFNDHYESLSNLQGIETIEDLFAESEVETDDFDEDDMNDDPLLRDPLTITLDELIQKDVERLPILLSGEMHVKGEGIYMFESDSEEDDTTVDGFGCDILEDGAVLIGDIGRYAVAPTTPYEIFLHTQESDGLEEPLYDDVALEIPGLWVTLHDVKVYDGNGFEVGRRNQALVPLAYPSLYFSKVIRREESLEAVNEVHIDVAVHFKGDFFREQCNIAENDLNYNDYTDDERHDRREEHQDELAIYMSAVDPDEKLIISAFNATAADGNERQLEGCNAYYLAPVIIKPDTTWRVSHTFLVENGEQMSMVHVLPEHLLSVCRESEK